MDGETTRQARQENFLFLSLSLCLLPSLCQDKATSSAGSPSPSPSPSTCPTDSVAFRVHSASSLMASSLASSCSTGVADVFSLTGRARAVFPSAYGRYSTTLSALERDLCHYLTVWPHVPLPHGMAACATTSRYGCMCHYLTVWPHVPLPHGMAACATTSRYGRMYMYTSWCVCTYMLWVTVLTFRPEGRLQPGEL